MNKLYHSIDKIQMEENKKKEIRNHIIQEYEKAGESVAQKRYRGSWKAAVAVLGVLILLGGSGALAVAGHHFDFNRDFQSFFGMDDQKEKKLQEDGIVQSPHIQDEHGGVIVEAERVIALDTECYVWLKITAPEEMRPLQDPMDFQSQEIYHNGKEVSSLGISFAHKKQAVKPSAEDPWNTILWQPEEGITYVHYSMGLGVGEKTWDNSTLQIKLADLVSVDNDINKEEPTSIDAENSWNLEIPIQVPEEIQEYSMSYNCPITDPVLQGSETNPQDITITKVILYPFSIGIEFVKPYAGSDSEAFWSIGSISGYEKKDGSIVKFDVEEGEGSSLIQDTEGGTCEMHNICDYIDTQDVVAIYLNETRIPLE